MFRAGSGFEEVGWDFAGSGCSADVSPAFGQPPVVSAVCGGFRASSDISADADPNTGVSVFDSYAPYSGMPYNWVVVGGTSVSSPFIAGLYARAGHLTGVEGPNSLYLDPPRDFNDIIAGSNWYPGGCHPAAICTAGPGWDGPTGLGTPHGLNGF